MRLRLAILLLLSHWSFAETELPNFNALYHTRNGPRTLAQKSFRLPKGFSNLVAKNPKIQYDDVLGVPTFLWAAKRLPKEAQPSLHPTFEELEVIAREYLIAYAPVYRLDQQGLSTAQLKSIHDTGSGCIIAKFKQTVKGRDVFCREINIAMKRNLELTCISGNFSPDVTPESTSQSSFKISPQQGIIHAFADLTGQELDGKGLEYAVGRNGYLYYNLTPACGLTSKHRPSTPIRLKEVLFQTSERFLPAYYIELRTFTTSNHRAKYYSYVISALDSELLFRNNLQSHADFSYKAFADSTGKFIPFDSLIGTDDSPQPSGKNDEFTPSFVSPNTISLQNIEFSKNDPWLADSATVTLGNNVDAFVDQVAPEGFNAGDLRASVNGNNQFNYTYDPSLNPDANTNQQMAAIVNSFYITNFLHDWFYDVGFNEAAGNAQNSNFGRGGIGSDALIVQGQSFSGRNNAGMTTPADGAAPVMQLLVFDDPFALFPDGYVTVISPLDITGNYPGRISSFFGPSTFDITGELVVVDDGVEITTDACQDIINGSELVGKIALIDRRVCFFTEKVLKAQNKGAIGVIIANNVGPSLPPLGGTDPDIVIPTMGIGDGHGELLKVAINQGSTVIVRLHDENIQEQFINRDSMVDNEVIVHEWGHYLTNRLIGDGNGLCNNQGRSLGEGWSDFLSLFMIVRSEDGSVPTNQNFSGVYGGPGAYVTGDNYFGFRRYPYSTDFDKNPLLFRHIEDGLELPDPGNGGPPVAFGQGGFTNSEVHSSGEVWCTMLWECYASMLRDSRYTFVEAQERMKEYLVASLKLTKMDPTYTEARDALLAVADATNHDDFILFSAAFAKRGLGTAASSPERFSVSHSGVVESFEAAAPTVRLEFVDAIIVEAEENCDNDGILDIGETGLLTVTLRNSGLAPLFNTSATVVSGGNIRIFNNGAITFPSSSPSEEIVGSVEIVLLPTTGNTTQNPAFTINYTDTNPDVMSRSETVSFRTNIDISPNQSTFDDVENGSDAWTIISAQGKSGVWRVEQLNLDDHVWFGPNAKEISDQSIMSPPFEVDSSGSFNLSFMHRFAFEPADIDGGVVEISIDNGLNWIDIGQFATLGYTGTLAGTNPIGNRPAYVNTSTNYPEFVQETINLGNQYRGETARIRFRIGSNGDTAGIGWHIDDVDVQGITNFPFTQAKIEQGFCGLCGNAFYDDNSVVGSASFDRRFAGNPNQMAGVLFDPVDFGFNDSFFITEVCVSNQLSSGGSWQNKLFVYPDRDGLPDETLAFGSGIISTGDGTGPRTLTFSPPIAHNGKFWVMNRGDPAVAGESLHLEFGSGPGTHSYISDAGISGLQQQGDRNYHLRATLSDSSLISFVTASSVIIEEVNSHDVGVTIALVNGGMLSTEVAVDVIDTTGGTADSPEDYGFPSQTVLFPQGSEDGARVTVPLSIVTDDLLEGDETIALELRNLTGPAIINANANIHQVIVSDFMVSLQKGWNLISLPIIPDQDVQTLFGEMTAGNIYAWTNDERGSFFTAVSKSEILKTLTGYWIYPRENSASHFPAQSLQGFQANTELNPGWNLFGPAIDIDSPYNDDIIGSIWFWDNNRFQPVLPISGRLEIGKAYWINSKVKQTYPLDLDR